MGAAGKLFPCSVMKLEGVYKPSLQRTPVQLHLNMAVFNMTSVGDEI